MDLVSLGNEAAPLRHTQVGLVRVGEVGFFDRPVVADGFYTIGGGILEDEVIYADAAAATVPEGIHLEFLPSHSPELQPSERLWPLSNEGLANHHFEQIEELEEALVDRCVALGDQPELVRSYLRYRWWPNAA
jgi:hypothetical protein